MRAPCQAKGEELGFYSEQRVCVPFTHTKKQRKPEPFPQGLPNPQIEFRTVACSQIRVGFAQVYRVTFNWSALSSKN